MKPNKIRIFLSMLVFSLAILSAGCGALIAPMPTPTTDPFTVFESPDGLFSLSVPVGWSRTNSRSTDGTLSEYKFISPAKNGFIQVVVAVRDEPVPVDIADAFTMQVLGRYMIGNDTVKILTDETSTDGRRMLTWHATQGLSGGAAIVERPGTNLILVIVSSLDAASAEYQPLFEYALSTYKAK